MKNIFIVFLFISIQALSQEISKEKMFGTWKVKKNITPKSDPKLDDLISGFNDASFIFSENGNFVLQSPNNSKIFLMTLNMLKNAQWKLDLNRQMI